MIFLSRKHRQTTTCINRRTIYYRKKKNETNSTEVIDESNLGFLLGWKATGNNEISLHFVGINYSAEDRADGQNYPNIRLPPDRHVEGIFTRTVAYPLEFQIFQDAYFLASATVAVDSMGRPNTQFLWHDKSLHHLLVSMEAIFTCMLYSLCFSITIPRSDSNLHQVIKQECPQSQRMEYIFFTRL